MPMKMASRKKAMPSIAKPRPSAAPKRPINRGQRMPNSKERMVPVTAPTANWTAITTDQRRAILIATGSLRASPIPSINRVSAGSATPNGTIRTWAASVNAIWIRLGRSALSPASHTMKNIMALRGSPHPGPGLCRLRAERGDSDHPSRATVRHRDQLQLEPDLHLCLDRRGGGDAVAPIDCTRTCRDHLLARRGGRCHPFLREPPRARDVPCPRCATKREECGRYHPVALRGRLEAPRRAPQRRV